MMSISIRAEPRHDRLHLVRLVDALRQRLVQVVESEIALFLGELDQFAELLLHVRLVDHADRRHDFCPLRGGRGLSHGAKHEPQIEFTQSMAVFPVQLRLSWGNRRLFSPAFGTAALTFFPAIFGSFFFWLGFVFLLAVLVGFERTFLLGIPEWLAM